MIVALIVACEIGFWVVLAAGLAARYLLRRPRLATVLLVGVPLIDVFLIAFSIVDLRRGSPLGGTHGLAALYLGFSVAFGPSLIRWADQRFAHRFAGGPAPVKPPRYGAEKVKYEWKLWLRCLLAWAITAAVTGVLALAAREATTIAMWGYLPQATLVTVIWLVGWPLWMTVAPPRPKG